MGMCYSLWPECSRGIAWPSASRAILFYEVAKLIEEKIGLPCGIIDQRQTDDFFVEGEIFIRFFDAFLKWDWQGENVEYLWGWAEEAAGMVLSITLEPRFFKHRHGPALKPVLWASVLDNFPEFAARYYEFIKAIKKFPTERQPDYARMPIVRGEEKLDKFAEIIEQTPLRCMS